MLTRPSASDAPQEEDESIRTQAAPATITHD